MAMYPFMRALKKVAPYKDLGINSGFLFFDFGNFLTAAIAPKNDMKYCVLQELFTFG